MGTGWLPGVREKRRECDTDGAAPASPSQCNAIDGDNTAWALVT